MQRFHYAACTRTSRLRTCNRSAERRGRWQAVATIILLRPRQTACQGAHINSNRHRAIGRSQGRRRIFVKGLIVTSVISDIRDDAETNRSEARRYGFSLRNGVDLITQYLILRRNFSKKAYRIIGLFTSAIDKIRKQNASALWTRKKVY